MALRIVFFGLPLAALLLARDGHRIELCAVCRKDALGLRRATRTFGEDRMGPLALFECCVNSIHDPRH